MLTFPPTHCSLSNIRWTKRHAWVVKRYCADTREGTRYRARFIGNHLLRWRFTVSLVGIVVYAAFMQHFCCHFTDMLNQVKSIIRWTFLASHWEIHWYCDCFDAYLFGITNGSIVDKECYFWIGSQEVTKETCLSWKSLIGHTKFRLSDHIYEYNGSYVSSCVIQTNSPLVLPSAHFQDANDLAK